MGDNVVFDKAVAIMMPPELTSLPIVGNYYRSSSEKTVYENAADGSFVILVADPSNRYDANAFKAIIDSNGKWYHVGFIQRHLAALLKANLKLPSHEIVVCLLRKIPHSSDSFAVPFGIINRSDAKAFSELIKDPEFVIRIKNKVLSNVNLIKPFFNN